MRDKEALEKDKVFIGLMALASSVIVSSAIAEGAYGAVDFMAGVCIASVLFAVPASDFPKRLLVPMAVIWGLIIQHLVFTCVDIGFEAAWTEYSEEEEGQKATFIQIALWLAASCTAWAILSARHKKIGAEAPSSEGAP